MTARKRSSKLTETLCKEYPFIKKGKTDYDAQCSICNSVFSVAAGGKNDITRHISSDKHKKSLQSSISSSKLGNFFCRTIFGDRERQLALSEAVLSFHAICHHHSFRSMDCTSKLIKQLFDKQFSCGRTKTELIIKNVLAPHAFEELQNELKSINFMSVFSDASNHKDIKLFPTLVRYFNFTAGVKIRLLDFVSLPGETSEIITNSIMNILNKNNLQQKIVAFCGDNANTNFGGISRKGTNNIFSRLKANLEQNIIGVGCSAHIIHNAIQTAADLLPIDIENLIVKIYGHFFIYTVRVETLKSFCDDADTEYHRILGYSKTRWLALLPAIERVLKLYEPLKSYFLSIEKCPKIIEVFFNNPASELWLMFLHNQSALFHNAVKSIEGDKTTIMETDKKLNELKFALTERMKCQFLPTPLRHILNKLDENGEIDKKWFILHTTNFYANCLEYLEKWTLELSYAKVFQWASLAKCFDFEDVKPSLDFISNHIPHINISEIELFDEISYIRLYVDNGKINKWIEEHIPIDLKWVEIFTHFTLNHIPFQNIVKIIEFILALPGTNAATERIFSVVNKLWTIEKTQMETCTVKAILLLKMHYDNSCTKLMDAIKENDVILKKIHSSQKYS